MASVNKVIINEDILRRLYVDELKSIPAVSQAIGASKSTVRARLRGLNLLRNRGDGIRLAASQGKLSHLKGCTRVFTPEWKANLAASMRLSGEARAKGVSLKPNGYLEITRGEHKGRAVHVVKMERRIGRRLLRNEVVHHIDEQKQNNDSLNLQLMTRSEHAYHHANDNLPNRKRASNGQFK